MNSLHSSGEHEIEGLDIIDQIDALVGPRPNMGGIALRAADRDDFGMRAELKTESIEDQEIDLTDETLDFPVSA